MPAVLFGSIGSLADTSELQREAFNEAFRAHDLDWNWSRKEYRRLLADSGGAKRIAAYADARGKQVDAAAVHRTKSAIFQKRLAEAPVAPRDGVAETIEKAQRDGVKLALVTTTSRGNIEALGRALAPAVDLDAFALVVDTDSVTDGKPAPDAYRFALERLGEDAQACVAIEDNAGGVQAATAAGVACVAFPGENNADHDFGAAARRVDRLRLDELQSLIADHPAA